MMLPKTTMQASAIHAFIGTSANEKPSHSPRAALTARKQVAPGSICQALLEVFESCTGLYLLHTEPAGHARMPRPSTAIAVASASKPGSVSCTLKRSQKRSHTPVMPAAMPIMVVGLRKFTPHCGRSTTVKVSGATAMAMAATPLGTVCCAHTTAPLPTKSSRKPTSSTFHRPVFGTTLNPCALVITNMMTLAAAKRRPPSMKGGKPVSASLIP